jgi:hypothetical protein
VTVTDQDVFGGFVPWFNQTFAISGGNSQGLFGARTSFLRGLAAADAAQRAHGSSVASDGPLIAGTCCSLQLLNFENSQQNAFALLVTATDGGGMSSSATVSVSLTDVNEAPVFQRTPPSCAGSDETCAGSCAARSTGAAVFTANRHGQRPGHAADARRRRARRGKT